MSCSSFLWRENLRQAPLRMLRFSLVGGIICGVVAGLVGSSEQASAQIRVNRKHTKTSLGPFPKEVRESAVISPDGRHLAYIQKADGKMQVVLDGKALPLFERIAALTFSPDSQQLAYVAGQGAEWFVVLGDRPQNRYSRVGEPAFSPDSKQLAYVALLSEQKRTIVVNGQPGKTWDEIFEGLLAWSPDSSRLAYGARQSDQWFVVAGQQQYGPYSYLGSATGLVWSADGRLVFSVLEGKQWTLMVDGQAQKTYDNLAEAVFSPDGKRLAYMAQSGQKWRVVLDGQEQPAFDALGEGTLMFSSDGKHLAYAARSGDKWFVVVDGQVPKNTYDSIGQMLFNPQGDRLAYVAQTEGRERVVMVNLTGSQPEHKEDRLWDAVGDGSLVFSPNGRRFGYIARSGRARFVVVDGRRKPRYDMVGYLTFTPDSRLFLYAATDAGRTFTIVDEAEAEARYNEIWLPPGKPLLVDPKKRQFHFIAVEKDTAFLVEEQID
ncbi:MAG: hypothetical protein NZ602_16200 [Thermoguttaceae bacterium]|nr:hypothetical protein [Thermoguttaceae bacterium]MDW8038374.1 hypothetical protein [Thermoguttaceae bacterium]